MEKRVDDVKMILLEAWCPFEDFGSNVYDNEGHMVLHGYRDDTWTVAIDKDVPDFLSPLEDGFGDYINLDINEHGLIKGWNKDDVTAFLEQLPDKAFQMK